MALGYDGKLYILAFDHRGSFQKKMFGIEGDPTPEETETISDAKRLIFEGMLEAVERGAEAGATGVLVDEQFGSDIPKRASERGLKLAMPVEKSGQNEFDFDYGEDFDKHIESFPTGLLEGARPLQLGRSRHRDERAPARAAQEAGATGCIRPIGSSSSSCSYRPPTRSWPASTATPSATTPSCAPS